MKFFLLLLAPLLAHAECDIYDSAHVFQGSMITTGSGYVGVFPGASDSTPYAGDFRGDLVRQGEKRPRELARVSGTHLFDLGGRELATILGDLVRDADGQLLATVHDPYSADGHCDSPGVALAGVALFVIYPQPNPGP